MAVHDGDRVNSRAVLPSAVPLTAVGQVLLDDAAVRLPDPDPELEALHRAILLEEIFGVTLADHELDPDVLAAPDTIRDVLARHLERR